MKNMGKEAKIRKLDALAEQLNALRAANARIVHCHGVFDLLHVGHIRHFEQAKKLGDVLVVTLTPDRFVNKGAGRPAFPENLRAEVVASLDCVDYVAINEWPSACETIKLLRPNVYAKGDEFKDLKDTINHVSLEEEAIRMIGGQMAFTKDVTFSSSALINQYLSTYPDEVKEFLADFNRRFSCHEVLRYLQKAESLHVLVLGEAIIDEYQFCEVMGKSGKEPVLATRYLNKDRFGGGVLACANHLAGFCERVDMVTHLGEGGDNEAFVRSNLKSNVQPTFFYKSKSPTIVKLRFVEKYLSQKLFEVYHMNDDPLSSAEDDVLCGHLEKVLPQYDLVIAADYGHGFFTKRAIDLLCKNSRFLAVNTQSNAGNNGMNTISKYPRADYVCLAHREYALETRDRNLGPEAQLKMVANTLACQRLMLTMGRYGVLSYAGAHGFARVPAFATQVIDRVGAGDAVLCLTSLCSMLGAPPEIVGFIGNVVGAEAVAILGNQRSIERIPLYRHVERLMKLHLAEADRDANSNIRIAA
jgi:rfaE bifunctional protein nucleotidyltransferase chain/domain